MKHATDEYLLFKLIPSPWKVLCYPSLIKKTPILIVDDDPGFLLTIKEILLCTGMPEPALISDSRQVIPLLETHDFQFILIDLMMPHHSGLELLSKIKSTFFDIQCVMVTAHEQIESAVEAMKIGAYDYLTKPVEDGKTDHCHQTGHGAVLPQKRVVAV